VLANALPFFGTFVLALAVSQAPTAETRLQSAWQALHPRQPLPPACPHPDPIREVTADFDAASPGLETALASLRFGVVLLSAQGQPLGAAPLHCGEAGTATGSTAPEVLELRALHASGLTPQDILLRTREVGRCGHIVWWQLLSRHGAELMTLLATEEEVDRACGSAPAEKYTAQITVPAPGSIRVTANSRTTLYHLLPSGKFAPTP
jgi:hypothetical protein